MIDSDLKMAKIFLGQILKVLRLVFDKNEIFRSYFFLNFFWTFFLESYG